MRTLTGGLLREHPLGCALALAVALTACAGRVGAADDARLVSRVMFDPSIIVGEAPPRSAATTGLVITPSFDASITSDPNAAKIMNTINAAIAVYQARFSDPITVSIKFQETTTGLGMSQHLVPCASCATMCGCGTVAYSDYRAHLAAHATTAADTTALAHLTGGAINPVNGTPNVWLNLVDLRVLGFSASPFPGMPDSTISLNTSICNLDRSANDPAKYDLMATVEHEIDESLGWVSALNYQQYSTAGPFPPDLFRYNQGGQRSFDTNPATQAFFSINGTTQLVRFNQMAGGDYNDWISFPPPPTPQVQDAFAWPGNIADLGVNEVTALDVIGYTPVTADSGDESGFVPPDKNTAKCEDAVAKNAAKLADCILKKCHIKQADAALAGKSFDEEACEQGTGKPVSCRTAYDNATAALSAKGTCPACLDASAQGNVADLVTAFLEDNNGLIYCAGSSSFGGDDTGFVPPDKNTAKCEDAVAKNVAKLADCILKKCHTKQADAALAGKSFDEEACEQGTGKPVSCRAAYDKATPALVAKGTCPACLDATAQSNLADLVTTFLDDNNGQIYCAGSTPLP